MQFDEEMGALGKCPRCEAEPVSTHSPVSRLARDGGAEMRVCRTCGLMEGLRGFAGTPVSIAEWPLSEAELIAEARVRIRQGRLAIYSEVAIEISPQTNG